MLYDGECGLCDRGVRFLLPRDRARVLTFAPLQGESAKELRARLRVPDEFDSMLFVRDAGTSEEKLYVRSTATLGILDVIGGPWRWLSWLRVVPAPLRDALYAFVAKRRIVWFGRLESCQIPDESERDRFLA